MFQIKLFTLNQVIVVIMAILLVHAYSGYTAKLSDTLDIYPTQPNEVLPIQPVLIYPKARKFSAGQHKKLRSDNDIIFVKLLNPNRSYHPKNVHLANKEANLHQPPREISRKNIFYVKALANGQFSPQRLKVYRLPEFYAINVYHKN